MMYGAHVLPGSFVLVEGHLERNDDVGYMSSLWA